MVKKYSREEELGFFERLRDSIGVNKNAIACLICGLEFRSVSNHVKLKHGISARDYKLRFDLPLSVGLTTPDVRKRAQENGRAQCEGTDKILRMQVAAGPQGSHRGHKQVGALAKTLGSRARKWQDTVRNERIQRFNERREEFTRQWLALRSPSSIAKFFGVDPKTVERMRHHYGLPERITTISLPTSENPK
jgi:hypothetical protein